MTFQLVRIPAGTFVMGDAEGFADELPRRPVSIEKPFWMMATEVSNALYHLYDSTHNSRFIDQLSVVESVEPCFFANRPTQPVIRVNWQQAVGFAEWMSQRTGQHYRLPTEAEWEWACRAGSDRPFWYGDSESDFSPYANLADKSINLIQTQGERRPGWEQWRVFFPQVFHFDDGNMVVGDVGRYRANPWGLKDMHGNVAEWTASDYRKYPYVADDGRNAGSLKNKKVVRGGSWRNRPQWSRAGTRLAYESWQRVYNVGFRLVCEE